ncbi:hypothetical protein DTO003C3_2948 [Penicillium roqueforti]|nr:hypothetical protein CBS147308_2380 [Penicillium roqueforti]KAI3294104.1 hypothetical protein DTO003C3_2948 [Penicillium roqueforti]
MLPSFLSIAFGYLSPESFVIDSTNQLPSLSTHHNLDTNHPPHLAHFAKMRLRSNHVLRPVSEYVPRRRRQTRSASAQAGTEAATETVPEAQSAPDLAEQYAAERPAPKRKPVKRAGRKKKAAPKGKKKAAPTAEPEAAAGTEADPQEDPVALIPSVEQPDTRTLPPSPTQATQATQAPQASPTPPVPQAPQAPPQRKFRERVMSAFRYGRASALLQREPERAPSPPQTPVMEYAWPPGQVYDRLGRIPWSLPWTPPSPWRNFPRRFPGVNAPDESQLTPTEEPTRKRNRSSEDDLSPSKRHKLTLQTPPGFENRPRGSSRRTYADRARRREAERGGRIDRTIYRFPQLLAQQGEDARSGSLTPVASQASEETAPQGNRIVPLSSLPSALPPNQNQNQNRPNWRQWIFNSVTGIWGRGNAPQTAEVPQVVEPEHPTGNDSVATPSSAPPSSSVVASRNFESPTPSSRVTEPQTANSRLTARARAPQVGTRKKYSYDLDPQGFDPELLARMRAGMSDPADLEPVTSIEQVRALYDNESKKRKRETSPDVIPHPPGCSYGFDPDYFIYDDDDDDDDLPTGEQELQGTPTKHATVSDAPEEEHVSKRLRQDPPTRQATVSDAPEEEDVSNRVRQDTPTQQATVIDAPEEEDVSNRVRQDTPTQQATVSNAPEEEHVSDNIQLESSNDQVTSEPIEYSAEELRKARQIAEARQTAEQYKPKTPSRLRAAHRFSSSCNSSIEVETVQRRKMRETSMATACPTGDLSQIEWPETETWIETFNWDDPNFEKYQRGSFVRTDLFPTEEAHFDACHKEFADLLAARRAA